jgi:hypothetical protein
VPAVAACAEAAGVSADRVLAARRASELLLVVPWAEPVASLEKLRGSLADAVTRLVGESGGAHAGVSGRAASVSALREAYRESARAVELGEMLDPAASIHFYDDYVLHDLFELGARAGDRLIAQMLDPLLRLGEAGERLIETRRRLSAVGAEPQDRRRRARDPPQHAHLPPRADPPRDPLRLRGPDAAAADRSGAAIPRAAPAAQAAGLASLPRRRRADHGEQQRRRPRSTRMTLAPAAPSPS